MNILDLNDSNYKKDFSFLSLLLFPAILIFYSNNTLANIANSDHDFRSRGWGNGELCSVCHSPHTASTIAPLWDRTLPTRTFPVYSSPTLNATVGQPDGSSKMCLSCHDGSVAGDILESHNDHPISFIYDETLATADGQLKDPTTATTVIGGTIDHDLLQGHKVQCSSCHDPHDKNNDGFFRITKSNDVLCLTCHSDNSLFP